MKRPILRRLLAASLLLPMSGWAAEMPSTAPSTTPNTLAEVRVQGGSSLGLADSASEGRIGGEQLALRPLLRPAEVLEAIPGMIVTQHSGDGKANQYFLRGFNLDHGSDFATWLMGMPLNQVSHAHGQGYMDVNFLIPELLGELRYQKGMQGSDGGNFATSGSARLDYLRQLPAPLLDLSAGPHAYRRLLSAGSHEFAGKQLLAAVEVAGNDGPWEQAENFRKHNALLRLSSGTANHGWSLSALAYAADWVASEHIPERAILSGEIGRYGHLVAGDGGRTQRHSLSAEWADSFDAQPGSGGRSSTSRGQLYAVDYRLNLFSAPSGYSSGLQGDQHEQADARHTWGGQFTRTWWPGPAGGATEADVAGTGLAATVLSAGISLRQDRIANVGLYDTVQRQRRNQVRADRISETAAGLQLEAQTPWTTWLRSTLGLRLDQIRATVSPWANAFNPANTGSAGQVQAQQASPRLGLVFGPFAPLGGSEYYAHWGDGFHSNDARGAIAHRDPQSGEPAVAVPLLVRARGHEFGLRALPQPGWETRLALWSLALDSELVFVGDAGVTEPKGASRRHGLEWSNQLRGHGAFAPLRLDADLAWSRARFTSAVDGGNQVPNAIPLTISLALSYADQDRHRPGEAFAPASSRWSGGLRLRYIGAYALESSGSETARPFWLAHLKLGYRLDHQWQLRIDLLNLFNKRANDIEYWGGACTRNEALAGACGQAGSAIDGRLLHPLEPRSLRIGLRLSF